MPKIGCNFKHGAFCDWSATPLMTEFRGARRVLIKAEMDVEIGDDVTLGDHIVINRGVSRPTVIRDRVFIWHHSIIGHDCIIKNDVCVGVSVTVSGVVEIGEYTYIGSGSVISPYAKIGKYCMIGAGSNIVHETVIPDGEMWFGSPAKRVRVNEWRPPI